MENVLDDVGKDLAKALAMVTKKAQEMGIDLDNLPDEPEPPPHESYPIFNVISKYGEKIEKMIKELGVVPIDTDKELIIKAVDVLSHSRHYIIAKVGRALSSKWEELRDPLDDIDDSKTSALFVYTAIERNSRALLALSRHKPLKYLKAKLLKYARLSLDMAQTIREEFFPEDKLKYEEFGYYDFR